MRSERLLELSLAPSGLSARAVHLAGRRGEVVLDIEIASLGEVVARPATVVGVPVVHLDLVVGTALLPLVVARPHRGDVARFVEHWRRLVEPAAR